MPTINRAQAYINLKNRIKNEVKRRKYTGSVESYGGASYDYTTTPGYGNGIESQHYNKILTPARAINPSGLPTEVTNGSPIIPISVIDAQITVFESKGLTSASTNTGCAASCTGLCSTTCTGTCNNTCTGSCVGNCSGSCSGGCYGCGGCDYGCYGCGGSCSYSCSYSCEGDCDGSCSGTCGGQCEWGCTTVCWFDGSGTCAGCDGDCTGIGAGYDYYSISEIASESSEPEEDNNTNNNL